MKNIGIFGIGCIGSIVSKYLILNKENNYFYFNRNHKDRIQVSLNDQVTNIPICLTQTMDQPLDWLIVCLKEYHVAKAQAAIKALINQETKIAIFRNGLHLADDYVDYVKPKHILETIIDCPTQKNKEGVLIQFKHPKITLPLHSISKEFIDLFTHPDINFNIAEDFKTAQWEKLIESSAIGTIQAVTKQTCSVFKDPKRLAEYTQLVKESIFVAQSDGIEIHDHFAEELQAKLQSYPDAKGSSMLSDAVSGRQLELDAKLGAIIQIANKLSIHIPYSQKIYDLLKGQGSVKM